MTFYMETLDMTKRENYLQQQNSTHTLYCTVHNYLKEMRNKTNTKMFHVVWSGAALLRLASFLRPSELLSNRAR